ncbi:MAG: YhcN/YlaJ family sporulation lipoprotein [Syntrophomonadaceae bacterium]|nr:YhcN/YlaJ family sporulation lipoprotein [Syntrophomonadaceae bacterium]MDD3889295.1 YhcN/YlaJ family sporulation lipoprotein [Syntrophomonadaceae bacterium]MDD4549856.1 YhcN/YlaJ family sporulation lipoprotein [Syntrophomonadaceae bacterium]
MRKKIALLVCISFLFTVMVGCQGAAKKPAVPERKPDTTTDTSDMTASDRRVMASNLSRMAEQVENVDKATVVVSGIAITNNVQDTTRTTPLNNKTDNPNQSNYYTQNKNRQNNMGLVVMVGLNLNDKAEKNTSLANTAKKNVASKLKASDKRISQVLVTTDPNLIKRINDVAAGIIEGRPIQEFQQDINDITDRVKREKPVLQ